MMQGHFQIGIFHGLWTIVEHIKVRAILPNGDGWDKIE